MSNDYLVLGLMTLAIFCFFWAANILQYAALEARLLRAALRNEAYHLSGKRCFVVLEDEHVRLAEAAALLARCIGSSAPLQGMDSWKRAQAMEVLCGAARWYLKERDLAGDGKRRVVGERDWRNSDGGAIWEQGLTAYRAGAEKAACPYGPATNPSAFDLWTDGWNAGDTGARKELG